MSNAIVKELMERTVDAHSRPRYGEVAWENAIKHLLTFRYTPEEAYTILMSKYMRWAADQFSGYNPGTEEEIIVGTEIIRYKRQFGIDVAGLMTEVTA